MYAVETQYQPTMPSMPAMPPIVRQHTASEANGAGQQTMDRLGFVQLVHRHLNQARLHGTCPAVVLVTLQSTENVATAAAPLPDPQWMRVLRERLRQQLRRSDLLLVLDGGCMGVILLDTQAQALPRIQQRLQRAMAWPPVERAMGAMPQLRMGAAVDGPDHGQSPEAETLVWAAERALRPITANAQQTS